MNFTNCILGHIFQSLSRTNYSFLYLKAFDLLRPCFMTIATITVAIKDSPKCGQVSNTYPYILEAKTAFCK